MTDLVLDAGALIALDRNNREVWAMLRVATDDRNSVYVPTGAIAQAWRDGSLQALLARALRHCDELVLEGASARAAGLLCGRSESSDVIDASVAVAAAGISRSRAAAVQTSDPDDIAKLLDVLSSKALVVHV